ncbi:hypothetical protein ABKN59_008801 [Abortiporus biennis]
MSSIYNSSESDWTESRPDKPLVVKCNYDGVNKRITFSSSKTCTYDLLKHRVDQCFSLYTTQYAITYTDDDGEVTDITTEGDLTEAIRYFHPGADDPPLSSAASILSGRSFGRGKITLRVKISVDYDGPSLSDTSSLASMEEYKERNDSEYSLSLSAPSSLDVDDDSVTVSSKDMGSKYDAARSRGTKTVTSAPGPSTLPQTAADDWDQATVSSYPQSLSLDKASVAPPRTDDSFSLVTEDELRETIQYPEDPSAVFERLRLQESLSPPTTSAPYIPSPLSSERGAAWLRDQNARTLKSMLGKLPEPSETDSIQEDAHSVLSGELALHRNERGSYYYSYESGPASSAGDEVSSIVFGNTDGFGSNADLDDLSRRAQRASFQSSVPAPRKSPTPSNGHASSSSSSSSHGPNRSHSEPVIPREYISADIPAELLPFISVGAVAPPEHPTDCSNCGALLETLRYVCSTCGEKQCPQFRLTPPDTLGKGKAKDIYSSGSSSGGSSYTLHSYPPRPHGISPAASASSWTVVAEENPFHDSNAIGRKPLPAVPISPSAKTSSPYLAIPNGHSARSSASSVNGETTTCAEGYELCANCIESVGVIHALESFIEPGSSPSVSGEWPPSPEDASQWRRSAPRRKGQLRHAYLEKVWGPRGWDNVEQDDVHSPKCSTCNTAIVNKRYKCASCKNFNLCRACYSQVHEIHPSHAFLIVPDKAKPPRSRSEPYIDFPSVPTEPTGEVSMIHPGVKCAHCMLDIVGARFHCAICASVDICSNCESAGLPGNLDSDDGGHNSSHIMIKIPYPLPSDELQIASSKAKQLWDRDAPNVEGSQSRPRRDSMISSYARTVMGPADSRETSSMNGDMENHGIKCDECNKPIIGVRFQCAICPSKLKAYNLCSSCEARSYIIHDPMHIFFKLPRPVDTPIECDFAMLPLLYNFPAGPPGGVYNSANPKEYLQSLLHTLADLCDNCEAVDTHDNTHFFMVLKSKVDMHRLRLFAQLDNTAAPPPVVPYAVYNS